MACVHVHSWAERGDFSVSQLQISLKVRLICTAVEFAIELELIIVGGGGLYFLMFANMLTLETSLWVVSHNFKESARKTKRIVNPSVILHSAPRPHLEQFALARFYRGEKATRKKTPVIYWDSTKYIELVLEKGPDTNMLFNF